MWDVFAQILGRHTAAILGEVTERKPDRLRLSRLSCQETLSVCELAVLIDFHGLLTEGREKRVSGYMACGAVSGADIKPLLKAMAGHLGLDPAILETAAGPQNILNEFLNIVIGLTGADWAEHGFEMSFSPPQVLSGLPLPPRVQDDQAFHLYVSAPDGIQVDIVVVFSLPGRAVISW